MLHKQDALARLEEQLHKLDTQEPVVLFRGSLRRDRNQERAHLVSEIDRHLVEYGAFLTCFLSSNPVSI